MNPRYVFDDAFGLSTLSSSHRTGNILLDESMPYLNHRKVRLTQEAENLQALFAEAENLVGSQNAPGQPKMVELIDTIMSIPSCLQVLINNLTKLICLRQTLPFYYTFKILF